MAFQLNEPGQNYERRSAFRQARDEDDFVIKPPSLKPVSGPPPLPVLPSPPQPDTSTLEDNDYETYTSTRPVYGQYTEMPTRLPSGSTDIPPWLVNRPTLVSTLTTTTRASYLWDNSGWSSTHATSSTRLVGSNENSWPTPGTDGSGYGPSGPPEAKENNNNGGMYAAAAIIPIAVIAILGGLVFLCLRKRKRRQKAIADSELRAQEIKLPLQPRPTVRAYLASPPAVMPPPFTSRSRLPTNLTSVSSQPIILGPIPSGSNGGYLTGIDTSDMVSMTSANNVQTGPSDPFSDNSSLTEPPPPYSPSGVAPPSFTSRHSSLRASGPPPATSQTHLIGPSPFADPVDDDAISEISSPIAERSRDDMSAVSDLSYQQEPTVTRTHL